MGFIRALTQGFKGTMGNQWLDFYRPMQGVPDSAALIPAVKVGTDNGMGQNTKGSSNVISNGSKIIVPDGYTLVTIENGTVTGCITEPGDYEFTSDNKYFLGNMSGNSIYADCLDGKDLGVRLDWYLGQWEIDYCYIVA